ncbi:hypothetical protein THIOSC13_1910008 [uncultured Thiomicrorhabdus sp.]
MGWHYSAKMVKEEGDTYYALVETYPDVGAGVHTLSPVVVQGGSLEELKKWLRIALEDLDKYPVIGEDNG